MNTLFIGGSRHVSRLPADGKKRLENVINSGHRVIVGDANGADKAVQKYLHDAAYDKVTVFCSGDQYRNNLGQWETHNVYPPSNLKGFHFYAAKDRKMAEEADFGLMIWDGKSAGTVLNVLRLVRIGKIVVLFNVPDKRTINIKTLAHWEEFISHCNPELQKDLRERATPEDWMPGQQTCFLNVSEEKASKPQAAMPADVPDQSMRSGPVDTPETDCATPASTQEAASIDTPLPARAGESTNASDPADANSSDLATSLNAALAAGDPGRFVNALGKLARTHRMTQVARDTGLARESLYRSLGTGGNPEFGTVLKVLSSLGFRLTALPVMDGDSGLEQPK
jgi:probable addiction module antidote protein